MNRHDPYRRVVLVCLLSVLLAGSAMIGCGGGGGDSSPGTGGLPPIATTQAATEITASGAVLNGSVNPKGLSTTAWFRYGTDPGLAGATTTTEQPAGSGDSEVPVSALIAGLNDNTTYYFRLEAQNSAGTVTGDILSFSNECSVNGTVDASSSYLFFDGNNELRGAVHNSGGTSTSFSLTLKASAYKIISITSLGTTSERVWTTQDAGGNNVFLLDGGAVLDLGGLLSSSDANGTRTVDITGTGTTASKMAPINVAGVWDTSATITTSNDPAWVVGQTYALVDNVISQSENRIDNNKLLSSEATLTGTIDGDLIVYSCNFDGLGSTNHYRYREYSTVNAAGDRFTGKNEHTVNQGTANYLITADVDGVKRP